MNDPLGPLKLFFMAFIAASLLFASWKLDDVNKHLVTIENNTSALGVVSDLIKGEGNE
jgi:hypothetical protein